MIFFSHKYLKKIRDLEDTVDTLNNNGYHIKEAGDIVFTSLPISILVYDSHYVITWENDYAKKVFKSNFANKSIVDIDVNLYNKLIEKSEGFLYEIDNEFYDVKNYADNNALFFFNVTERVKLQKKYDDRVNAIGIIKLDNLNESLNVLPVQDASQIRGEFLGVISDLAQNYKACLQNIDDDKLLFITNKDSLRKMVDGKFDCLNVVRDIASRNHLKTSMSIGFACYDKSYQELASMAQSAVDLAERRGGDQAVINIEGEDVKYFGGKAEALEKNSLVKARTTAQSLKEAIEKSNLVYITGHKSPDADCIGSMLAVLKMALSVDANARIVLDFDNVDGITRRILDMLENEEHELYSHFVSIEKVDLKPNSVQNALLIICDTQGPKIMCYEELYNKIPNRFVIDHHRSGNPSFENCMNLYVDAGASSAVELVSEMFPFFNKDLKFTPCEASIMLAGIVIDTNNFVFSTRARTFEAASALKQSGADMLGVNKLIRDDYKTEEYIANAFLKAEFFEDEYAIVKLEDVIDDRTLLAKISDKLLTIDKVTASFTIAVNTEASILVSARSIDDFNVQLVMEEMGGGGHKNAAATQIQNKSINEVYSKLKDILYREKISKDTGEVKNMEVILLEDVKGKGKKDSIIKVANGYGNYLLNQKLAVPATEENRKNLQIKKEADLEKEKADIATHTRLKNQIDGKDIDVYIKVGQDGKTFGHITVKQICEEFEAQTGITLDKKKVSIPEDINFIGIFKATVNLYKGITATFNVHVLEMK